MNRDFRDLLAEFKNQGVELTSLLERTPSLRMVTFARLRITAIDGVTFEEAWYDRLLTKFADQPTAVLSKEHLIRNKRAAGRTQDLADIEWLETNNQQGRE